MEVSTTTAAAAAEFAWEFFNDLLIAIQNNMNFGLLDIYLDGGRKGGKTFRACKFAALATLLKKNDVDVYGFRWLKTDIHDLNDELVGALERALGRELSKTEANKSRKIYKVNNNTIRVLGLHNPSVRKKHKLTGIKREIGKKYAILILEEAYEFSIREMDDIFHAVGGYQNYIVFYITNPNSLALPFIKARENEFAHHEPTMKTKGYQFKQQSLNDKHHKIWFYCNWRINPYLSHADINLILKTWETDPQRARVVDYGMPGIEENGIYEYEIPKIRKIPLYEIIKTVNFKKISAGIDWGDGSNENASATTCCIVGLDYNNAVYILDTYKHDNHVHGYKEPTKRVEEIINLIVEFSKLKPEITWTPFEVYMDTGLYAEMEFFNLAKEYRNLQWLNFDFATKYQERTRITVRKYRMNTGRYVVADHISNIIEELSLQTWDDTKKDKQGLPKQKDEHNHLTDAEDYALSSEFYSITNEEQFQLMNKRS